MDSVTNKPQVLFTANEMPASIVGQALKKGMESDWLHPVNAGQSYLSRTVGKYVLRPLARLVYAVAVGLLLAPLGAAYHLTAAAYNKVVKADHQRAWEHLKAASSDAIAFISLGIGTLAGGYMPAGSVWYSYGGHFTRMTTQIYFNYSTIEEGDRRTPHNYYVSGELMNRI